MAHWWQTGVVYQVYPRSFQDSNGDGVGDLNGITERLPKLKDLGVDAIWISPIFPSPMVDFGYDVANYCDIDPVFGTLEDFDELLERAHAIGLKVLLDFVPNHTSDQHPWFIESRSSRTNAKRDWYLWRDAGEGRRPPNNWISDFGGPAWEWDEPTGQYYEHAFLPQQPDLNWRNPYVRAAMYEVMRFWFRRGVDGFRIDVLWHMIKAEDLRDNPPNPDYRPEQGEMFKVLQTNSTDQPEVFEIVRDMRKVADEFGDRVLIGEIYLPFDRLAKYYGESLDGVHLPFNFHLINAEWNARHLHALIADYERSLPNGAWPNWVLGNHDRSRIASRVGEAQARVAAMLLLTLRGTPTIYNGDELGLEDVEIPLERAVDPRELREPGLGLGRDPERTPIPWTARELNAGFSTASPWLPMNSDWKERNAESLRGDAGSILNLYRDLLKLRREHAVLNRGDIELHDAGENVLMYSRTAGGSRMTVALNFGARDVSLQLPPGFAYRALLSTHDPGAREDFLRANEGVVFSATE